MKEAQEESQFQNEKQKSIYEILTQKTLFQPKKFTKDMLNVDLVMKIKIPDRDQANIKRSDDIPLSEFLYNPSLDLQKAYDIAYKDLLKQIKITEINEEKFVLLPNRPYIEDVYGYQQYLKYEVEEEDLQLNILYKKQVKKSEISAFLLKYNTLMYVLQQKCGFKIFSFVAQQNSDNQQKKEEFIYILVTQTTQNLMRSADRHKIKKQVDYCQLDLFLNDPCDQQNRPLKFNNKIKSSQNAAKLAQQSLVNYQILLKSHQNKQNNKQNDYDQYVQKKLKRINRKLSQKTYNLGKVIIQEANLWEGEIKKFNNYFNQNLQTFQSIITENYVLSPQQKNYILTINRNKVNDGCYKEYILKKKRKKYFIQITNLNNQHGYQNHQIPSAYHQFSLPNKKKSFFEKLRSLLFYEEYVISPYGDLSLFLKMEKIKIAYMTLKQYVRAENFKKIDCQIFTLHDNFQLFGKYDDIHLDVEREIKSQIKGGINGKNVHDNWSILTPWSSDIQLLRSYFGQETAFFIYLKNHFITYFILIMPLSILAQAISRLLVYLNKSQVGTTTISRRELAFHAIYFVITTILYNVFLQFWKIKQQNYFENFVQKRTQSTFKYGYRGPFIRNVISDSVNEYPIQLQFKYQALQLLFTLIMVMILFAQAGIFFGFRMMIVSIYKHFPSTNFYLISWPHILSYGVFFALNGILYEFCIKGFTKYLSKKQNSPTNQQYKKSYTKKNYIFVFGIQLLGPFFLLIIEPFAKTSCYSSQCYSQLTYYIYSRYFFVFCHLAYKLANFLFKYFKSGVRKLIQQQEKYIQGQRTFFHQFDNLTKKVQIASKKIQFLSDETDQTLAILHYAIFATSFPLSPVLSLGSMILQYGIQKIQLIGKTRRPIPKSQPFQSYVSTYTLIMHIGIFINVWIMIFTLQQVQYVFQSGIQAFVGQSPTQQGVLALKIIIIAIFIIIYQVIAVFTRIFTSSGNKDAIQKRKTNKLNEYIRKKFNNQRVKTEQKTKIRPLRTIFRTYHRELVDKLLKKNTQTKQIQENEQFSAMQFKKSKKT